MSLGFPMIVCSFIYSILICFIYFKKQRVNSLETNLYGVLVITNLINLIMELLCCYTVINIDKIPSVTEFINRLFLIVIFTWQSTFTLYIYAISFKEQNDTKLNFHKKIGKIFVFFCALSLVFMMILPLYYYHNNDLVYSYGPSANLLYIIVFIYFINWIIFYVNKSNKDKNNKYLPIIAFIVVNGIALIIRAYEPGFLIISFSFAFVTNLMYFTIENPDIKLINELELAREEADRANMAKTDFLSSTSHEIRTPLNAIIGFSNAIDNASNLEEAKEDAKDIVMAGENLLELVNGILDISKIEANKMEIVEVNYNIKKLVRDLEKLISPRLKEKTIDFKIDIAKDVPDVLYGDMGKVKEVMSNLLTNACKYTESGFIKLSIQCVNNNNKSNLIISVEDSGRGIKKETIDKLFTKFQRLDEDKNTTLDGTGLGLAITKSLVTMMGGKIVVSSDYGKGSKFSIYLSQKIISMVEEEKEELEVIEENIVFSNKKILVVDDNKLNLKVASKLLGNYQVIIDTCLSGFEAIEMLKSNNYNLILLDDMMPKLSGKEVLKELKKNKNFKTPVVVLTANAISGMKDNYLELGFDDYLAKPIDKEELKRILNKFI